MNMLLTGASRGIGKAIRDGLLDAGHRVTGTSRADIDFQREGYTHQICDLSNHEQLLELKEIFQGDDVPDVLINNAGIFQPADVGDTDEEWLRNWDHTMQVNLRSASLLTKWAVQAWKTKGIKGRAINISSRAGQRGDTQEYISYAASKAGMIGMTKSIARSFGRFGITAYTIAPGFVDTDMARESIEVYGEEYLTNDLFLDSIAPPEEFVHLILLLAEGKLIHATGQTFHVNSGSYLP